MYNREDMVQRGEPTGRAVACAIAVVTHSNNFQALLDICLRQVLDRVAGVIQVRGDYQVVG